MGLPHGKRKLLLQAPALAVSGALPAVCARHRRWGPACCVRRGGVAVQPQSGQRKPADLPTMDIFQPLYQVLKGCNPSAKRSSPEWSWSLANVQAPWPSCAPRDRSTPARPSPWIRLLPRRGLAKAQVALLARAQLAAKRTLPRCANHFW